MPDISLTNWDTIKNVPYLNLVNPSIDSSYVDYIADLSNIDLSLSDSTDISSIYTHYKTIRTIDDSTFLNEDNELYNLDEAIIDSLRYNKEYLFNNNYTKSQNMRAIINRIRNLENSQEYNDALQLMLKDDISNTNVDINDMKQNLHNKNRFLEIRNFYDKKMNDQINIFKFMIFVCCIMLFITFFYKNGFISDNIFVVLIGVGISVLVIYVIGKLIDIILRDSNVYDEYNYYTMPKYYINSDGSGIEFSSKNNDTPLYEQQDLISNKCYNIMNKS